MSDEITPAKTPEPIFLIELNPSRPMGLTPASRGGSDDVLEAMQKRSRAAVNAAMDTIRAAAYQLGGVIESIDEAVRPDEMEVEFVVRVDVHGDIETGKLSSMVVKSGGGASAGGQFAVRFKWDVEQPNRPKVLVSQTD